MQTYWDYQLIALSIIIAIIGSYIALDFAGRMKSAAGRRRKFWFVGGALTMGLAIWSMHFVGMLALIMPMAVRYNITLSALSIFAATVGSGIAFTIMNRQTISRIHLATGSTAMGLAILTMHYTGMASMEMPAAINYNPALFTLSGVIAVGASAAALWLAFNLKRDKPDVWFYQKVLSAIVMGFAISGMHYTGMAAASYTHTSGEVTSGLNEVPLVGFFQLSDLLIGASAIFGLALLLLGAQATGERQRALEALRKSEERYELVIEGSSDGIWDWDHLTNTIYWNKRCYDQLGIPYDTSITRDVFFGLIHPDDKAKSLEIIQRHLELGEPYEIEYRLRHSSGEYYYFLARGKTVRDASGKPLRTAGVRTDIHARKELEIQLEEAKQAAEIANQKKSEFLAKMSHELRTPLNAVIGYSEMMLKGLADTPEKHEKYATAIALSGRHLLNMVNDILDIAKIEAGKISLSFAYVEFEPLFEELLSVLNVQAEVKQVEINLSIQPGLTGVEADPARLRQIFFNLISNAIKFNKPQGKVQVRLYSVDEGKCLTCEIEDTGIGIPEEKFTEMFTEFYQVDNDVARQYEGTGLGLALTKYLVELHGGSIYFESKEGVGTTFIFKLPIQNSEGSSAENPAPEKSLPNYVPQNVL